MNKQKLLDLLKLFENSRKKLTEDFISENPYIYSLMFEYGENHKFEDEENHQLMKLSIEKYFTEYINHHFKELEKFDDLSEEFNSSMFLFLKSFDVKMDNKNGDLFSEIIHQKLTFLKDIILKSNNDINNRNKLIYSYQKDKTLFDREIKKLIENKKEK